MVHQKQFNFAEKTAHLILKRDPNNSKIFDLIGDIHNAQNQQMQSIWYYYSSLDRQFNNKTLYKLGTNIYYLGKYDEAEKILNSVIFPSVKVTPVPSVTISSERLLILNINSIV